MTTQAPQRARPQAQDAVVGSGGRRSQLAATEAGRAWELTTNLVRRDLKVRHRGTFLGMLWSLTNPVLVVALYYVIFKYIIGTTPVKDVARPDQHPIPFALYFFCGLTLWNVVSNTLSAATTSVIGSGYLLRKVYFPRMILPLSTVISSLVTFGFEFAVLVLVTLVAVGTPTVTVLWVPVIVLVAALLAFGFALILSSVTVFLRDTAHFIGVLLQLWFWGTPIIYSLQFVAHREGLVRILELNPVTGLVVSFRNVVLLGHGPNLALLGYDALFAGVMIVVGVLMFQHWQRLFPEIV